MVGAFFALSALAFLEESLRLRSRRLLAGAVVSALLVLLTRQTYYPWVLMLVVLVLERVLRSPSSTARSAGARSPSPWGALLGLPLVFRWLAATHGDSGYEVLLSLAVLSDPGDGARLRSPTTRSSRSPASAPRSRSSGCSAARCCSFDRGGAGRSASASGCSSRSASRRASRRSACAGRSGCRSTSWRSWASASGPRSSRSAGRAGAAPSAAARCSAPPLRSRSSGSRPPAPARSTRRIRSSPSTPSSATRSPLSRDRSR